MMINAERKYGCSPEVVYGAWVAEETLVAPVTRIEKDVRVGGYYRLFVEMENFTGIMSAEYQEVIPGKKLVYSWEWNDDGEKTVVSVNFEPDEQGCIVRLTHGEFKSEESQGRHAYGWESYFDGLEKQVASRPEVSG
jgi:uncharacterized protein YndB with AHSA1/START domain